LLLYEFQVALAVCESAPLTIEEKSSLLVGATNGIVISERGGNVSVSVMAP